MSGKTNSSGSGFIPRVGLIILLAILTSSILLPRDSSYVQLRYGEFKSLLQANDVTFRNVRIGRSEIRGEILTQDAYLGVAIPKANGQTLPAGTTVTPFRTSRYGLELDDGLQPLLDKHLGTAYQADEEDSLFRGFLSLLMTFVLLIGALLLVAYLSNWVGRGGMFTRSRHRLYKDTDKRITFADVAGIDEAVAELREVVDFLKTPEKYQAIGGRIPKGVLLVGPPGTGKTLLARAVAGEAGVPFISLSGSEFVELYVGVGASRVRDLFRDADSRAPCIVFIDELDAMGKSRSGATVHIDSEREQTLNQLLVEMDGFSPNRGVIIMAATNRPETLDSALLRPGRFDRTVVVDPPDVVGREAILRVHAKQVKLAEDVDLSRIAALTPGMSGADLANLVNEAALLAARAGKEQVSMGLFEEAIERGAVGLERKTRLMRPEDKRRVAFHEAGHALVACTTPGADPVHKVSIIPRGVGVGGYVLQRPEGDRSLLTRRELEATIHVLLGGTLAEEVIFREISTGAVSDLQKANQIARKMVSEFGMSELGRIYVAESAGAFSFNGTGEALPSETTRREMDLAIRRIIDDATSFVRSQLQQNEAVLRAIAEELCQREVIDGNSLRELLKSHGLELAPA